MAVCNANYEFTLVDIGDSGRQSDGSVYANSHLGYAIESNYLNTLKVLYEILLDIHILQREKSHQ